MNISWQSVKEKTLHVWKVFQEEKMKQKEQEKSERIKKAEDLLKQKKNKDNPE